MDQRSALRLIDAAAEAGANMVKVQCFKPELIRLKAIKIFI